jgi:coenzyme F420-0:L-glutamate ligase
LEIIPLKTTHIIEISENLMDVLDETLIANNVTLREKDVLVITEKVAALTQGRVMHVADITDISEQAQEIASEYNLEPGFVQLILNESSHVFGGVEGMLLTVNSGIMIGNAGIDHSNAGLGDNYILWPANPYDLAADVVQYMKNKYQLNEFGVSISDSRVQPLKRGVVGVSIGVAGFYPIEDCRGKLDLFGYKMHFKVRALADQITDAAIALMGETNEQTPFALIHDAPVPFTDEPIDPNMMIMPMDEDLFVQILKKYDQMKIK